MAALVPDEKRICWLSLKEFLQNEIKQTASVTNVSKKLLFSSCIMYFEEKWVLLFFQEGPAEGHATCPCRDSNLKPLDHKTNALPLCYNHCLDSSTLKNNFCREQLIEFQVFFKLHLKSFLIPVVAIS